MERNEEYERFVKNVRIIGPGGPDKSAGNGIATVRRHRKNVRLAGMAFSTFAAAVVCMSALYSTTRYCGNENRRSEIQLASRTGTGDMPSPEEFLQKLYIRAEMRLMAKEHNFGIFK